MSVALTPRRRVAGFTLLEVVVAMALLAAGLLVAIASVRSAAMVAGRGEHQAMQNESMRASQAFLRQALVSAEPVVFGSDPVNGRNLRFQGDAAQMDFVSALPGLLGTGGPQLHQLRLDESGQRLWVAFSPVVAGRSYPDPAQAPETLALGVREVRFSYRGLQADRSPGPWLSRWDRVEALPLQVRIEVQPVQGPPWPALVVTLVAGSGQAGGGAP